MAKYTSYLNDQIDTRHTITVRLKVTEISKYRNLNGATGVGLLELLKIRVGRVAVKTLKQFPDIYKLVVLRF